MRKEQEPKYTYSTYANSVGALLHEPLKAFLSDAPSAALPVTGGLVSQTKENIRFNVASTDVIRVGRASSTVFGELQKNQFISMASSTVENLNILDVITADAVVSKVTSISPVPVQGCERDPVSHPGRFFTDGSHFENLKIDGKPYNFTVDPQFSGREGFSIEKVGVRREPLFIDCPEEDIYIPQFGTIHFGEVVIYGAKIILTMLRVELGCQYSGSGTAGTSSTNGIDGAR